MNSLDKILFEENNYFPLEDNIWLFTSQGCNMTKIIKFNMEAG